MSTDLEQFINAVKKEKGSTYLVYQEFSNSVVMIEVVNKDGYCKWNYFRKSDGSRTETPR
jgi:hypothetical protein